MNRYTDPLKPDRMNDVIHLCLALAAVLAVANFLRGLVALRSQADRIAGIIMPGRALAGDHASKTNGTHSLTNLNGPSTPLFAPACEEQTKPAGTSPRPGGVKKPATPG
jgi:hypothetical protein